ncbi:MAG: toxic anion resistance protein, partial [Erysipelotrichia bacterium]|nr:toxic anion resistance protein [Erysipelotrichia bacterium]
MSENNSQSQAQQEEAPITLTLTPDETKEEQAKQLNDLEAKKNEENTEAAVK